MPVFHECQRCTACCRWPGQVRLAEHEIVRLAAHLRLDEHQFIQQFTRLTSDRHGLALKEKPAGQCIFLAGEDCSVQPVKPQHCRAIPREVTPEEWRRLIERATGQRVDPPSESKPSQPA